MCKILMVAGVSRAKQKAANKFLMAALPLMAEYDKDGVGFVASDIETGALLGERWLDPKHAFRQRNAYSAKDEELVRALGLAVEVEETYNSFGNISRPFSAAMLHTRMATCGVNLENVHPFVSDDTALIHNGVISNPDVFKRTLSTCDSEAIHTGYLSMGVDTHAESIEDLAAKLEGYYACGVLGRDRDGTRILDIFKSEGASLHVAWVKSLDAWVYCTKAEIIQKACKKVKTTCSAPREINAGWLIRINASTGAVMGTHRFTPRKRAPVLGFNGSGYSYRTGWASDEAEKCDRSTGGDVADIGASADVSDSILDVVDYFEKGITADLRTFAQDLRTPSDSE